MVSFLCGHPPSPILLSIDEMISVQRSKETNPWPHSCKAQRLCQNQARILQLQFSESASPAAWSRRKCLHLYPYRLHQREGAEEALPSTFKGPSEPACDMGSLGLSQDGCSHREAKWYELSPVNSAKEQKSLTQGVRLSTVPSVTEQARESISRMPGNC